MSIIILTYSRELILLALYFVLLYRRSEVFMENYEKLIKDLELTGSNIEELKENIKNIMIMMITKKYFNLYKDREVNTNDEIKIK